MAHKVDAFFSYVFLLRGLPKVSLEVGVAFPFPLSLAKQFAEEISSGR
jgi:hypothetical protein